MTSQIKTPVNDKISNAIDVLKDTYKTACNNRDWGVTSDLSQMIENLACLQTQTRESQILGVEPFLSRK